MHRIRPLAFILGAILILALAVAGCGGSDEPEAKAAAQQPAAASSFQIMSPNFSEIRPRVRIPPKHTCVEGDASPPLSWSGAPAGTVTLALIADDPEHEAGLWVHWVLYNIPPDATGLPEGVVTTTDVLPDGTTQGVNDFKRTGYGGPCPPLRISQEPSLIEARSTTVKPHKYFFRLYALDTDIGLAAGATKDELLDAMDGHILAEAETAGKYLRPQPVVLSTSESPIPNTPTPTP